jgi:L-aminopeptidase/D-esterase-like protein
MAFLEEKGRGVSFSGMTVPIVVGASLFDLNVGDGSVRPDAAMGYAAAQAAATTTAVGNVGAGCGASVGKLLGPAMSMKGGLGAASITLSGVAGTDTVTVSAVVAVNALGCIYDRAAHLPNQPIAGVLDPSQRTHGRLHVLDGLQAIMRLAATSAADEDGAGSANAMLGANTTIGCILTDARLAKTQAARVSVMAHDGLARAIDPVHTGFDGDAVFCLASGSAGEGAQPDVIGAFAALVMELAVVNAARAAQSAYGLLAASDLV